MVFWVAPLIESTERSLFCVMVIFSASADRFLMPVSSSFTVSFQAAQFFKFALR